MGNKTKSVILGHADADVPGDRWNTAAVNSWMKDRSPSMYPICTDNIPIPLNRL